MKTDRATDATVLDHSVYLIDPANQKTTQPGASGAFRDTASPHKHQQLLDQRTQLPLRQEAGKSQQERSSRRFHHEVEGGHGQRGQTHVVRAGLTLRVVACTCEEDTRHVRRWSSSLNYTCGRIGEKKQLTV